MLSLARRLSSTHHRVLMRADLLPASQRLFTCLPLTDAVSKYSRSPRQVPTLPLSIRVVGLQHTSLFPPIITLQNRSYARRSGRNPWDSNGSDSDWLTTVKTGALLAVGAGAVVAAASVGFGFIMFGAAGYGIYTLYQRFFAPYRSNDPFGSVQADIDRIVNNRKTPHSASRSTPMSGDKDLESLVEGLPFVVRGLVKTLFSFVGGAMKSSMARAGELRRLANDAMRANASITSQLGDDVSLSTPQNWMEYTVNGAGRVEAVFPVAGDGFSRAHVTAKAMVGTNGELTLQELKYRNPRTGDVIDLLRDAGSSVGRRKKVVEAEYVDLDDRK